jgi:ligand-binding sensor domain-containing protein
MLTQTDDGKIWAGSFSNGLFHVEDDTLRKVDDPKERFKMLTNLLPIGNTLLADSRRTIFKLRDGKIIDTLEAKYPNVEFPINARITAMTADSKGKLWLGMERGGVLVYDTLTENFTKFFSVDNSPFYHRINKILEAKNGDIWILTKANGLAIYNPSTDSFTHLTKDPLIESSLSGNNCTSIIQDKTGIIWVGSTGDLNKYDQSKIKFKHIYYNPYNQFSLNDNMVRGVYEDANEKLWVGTDGGIIHIIDRKNETIEKIPVTLPGFAQPIVPVYFLELTETTMLLGTSVSASRPCKRRCKCNRQVLPSTATSSQLMSSTRPSGDSGGQP